MTYIKVPSDLVKPPYNNRSLKLKGISLVDSCWYDKRTVGSMFLDEHIIMFVLNGVITISHKEHKYTVRRGEFILLKKASYWNFIKELAPGDSEQTFHGLLFVLQEEVLDDFVKKMHARKFSQSEFKPVVRKANIRLTLFLASVRSYLDNSEIVEPELLRLRVLELLYGVIYKDSEMLTQLSVMKQPARMDISEVINANYMYPCTLPELAYLSGRSLSGFKRDFAAIYDISPSLLIKRKRLVYAKRLLKSTDLSIKEICYMSGFENVSHFSRVFKTQYGKSPSLCRLEPDA